MSHSLYETEAYVNSYHSSPGERIYRILELIPTNKNDVIADYACGSGLLASALDNNYRKYCGIDTSSSFIKRAKQMAQERKLRNTNFINMDIIKFAKTHTNKFTKAFTLDFSEHIDNPLFLQIYSEIRKTLKKNGILIIHTPNKDFLLEKLKGLRILPQTSGHIAIRNFEEYEVLLKKCGYKNIKIK